MGIKMEIEHYIDAVIDHFATDEAVVLNAFNRVELSKEQFLDAVRNYIKTFKLQKELQEQILNRYKAFLWNYDILDPLIAAEDVTDIHCNAFDSIRVKRIIDHRAVRMTADIRFESKKHFRRFVEHLAIRNKINLSEQNALQNFVDKKSNPDFRLRCNITTDFLTCDEEPFLYIRKEAKRKKSLEQLIQEGMFPRELLPVLQEAVKGAVIVSGESGSGKSILINAALEEIPKEKNVLVIQADDELFSESHPDVKAVHTVEQRGNGITYHFHDLARNAMLLDRDYIIFSEVKSQEARDAFTAALTGHNPWLSLHAPNARASMYQFANYVKTAADFTLEDIFRMLAYTRFTLIHLSGFKIDGLTRIAGWDEEKKEILFEDLL